MMKIMTLMVITIMALIVIMIRMMMIMAVVILMMMIMMAKCYDCNFYDDDGVGAGNYTDDGDDGIIHGSDDSDYDVLKYCGYNDGGEDNAGCAKCYLMRTATASWLFLLVAWISAVLPLSSATSM